MEDTAAVQGLMWAADAAVTLGDHAAAATLYDRLRPHAHRFGVSGIATATQGSVSRPLGRVAHLLGWWDAAERHLRDGVAAHQRAGATLLLAHALSDQAAMLRDRHTRTSSPADQAAADAALEEALAIYRALGLDWRAEQLEQAGQSTAAGPQARNAFRCDGDMWTRGYRGIVVHVHDVKGLHDLATLLAHPGREFHVLDLVSAPAAAAGAGAAERLHEQGHAGALIDEQARRTYRRRLADLDSELAEAQSFGDQERSARLATERDALVGELARAHGLGGRARRAGDPTERARSAVTWRIRSAIKRIGRAHPPLGTPPRRLRSDGDILLVHARNPGRLATGALTPHAAAWTRCPQSPVATATNILRALDRAAGTSPTEPTSASPGAGFLVSSVWASASSALALRSCGQDDERPFAHHGAGDGVDGAEPRDDVLSVRSA